MDIRGLGYIGLNVADLDAWETFARDLGAVAAASDDSDSLEIRVDERPYRILVQRSNGAEGITFAGWELANPAALDGATRELEAAGLEVAQSTAEERDERRVRGLVRVTDPSGLALELFWGPVLDHELFVSPSGVSGFVTGDLGLGHIVLGCPDLEASTRFYTEVLGFRVSDYFKPGQNDIVFTRCNPRHHSLALASAPDLALYHFMLEARTLDDVGYTLDRLRSRGTEISMGLGRHTNDQMVSFYSASPSGFDVEFGCGGLRIDDATWNVSEITKASWWGHQPLGPASG